MSAHDTAVTWCVGQTALLAGLGLIASWSFRRRIPATGVTAGCTAIVMIALLTLLIPAQLPSSAVWSAVERRTLEFPPARSVRDEVASTEFPQGNTTNWLLDVKEKIDRALTIVPVSPIVASEGTSKITAIVMWAFAAGAAIGLGRLTLAVFWTMRLRRARTPISNEIIRSLFGELKAELGVRQRVELCESTLIISPALVGWLRPIIFLPAERLGWSEQHLRATLAHELAHLVRGDYFWRTAARMVVAIHWSQPLVHGLVRRLTLLQEVAADRLAAQAVGGVVSYRRALSELAIRLDDQTQFRGESLVLPALSSHLARRMEMLRSKDGAVNDRRRVVAGLASALIAFFGIGLAAIRAVAESGAPPSSLAAAAAKPFSAEPIDLSFLAPAERGILLVRPHALSQDEDCAPLVGMAQAFVQNQIDELLPSEAEKPRISLDEVDYVAVSMHVVEGDEAGDADTQSTTAMCEIVVRTLHPVNIQAWLGDHVPNAEIVSENGWSFVRAKVGDEPHAAAYAAQRDPHTIVMTCSVDRLRTLVGVDDNAAAGALAEKLNGIGGGVAAIVVGQRAFSAPDAPELASRFLGMNVAEGQPNPWEAAARDISEGAQTIGMGIDLGPQPNQVSLRMKFGCADAGTAERVRDGVELFRYLAKAMADHYTTELAAEAKLEKPLSDASRLESETTLCCVRLFADAKLESRPQGDKAVDVWFETTSTLPTGGLKAIVGASQLLSVSVTKSEVQQ